jgi:hypothetical protein
LPTPGQENAGLSLENGNKLARHVAALFPLSACPSGLLPGSYLEI